MFKYWMGDEDSLNNLVEVERLASSNFVDLMDRRKAFLDTEEPGEDQEGSIGAYLISRQNDTAVIRVSGSLTNGHRWYHEYLDGQVTSYEAINDALKLAAEDDTISDIVLSISSGGGAVSGLESVSETIRRVNAIKPVVAHTNTAAFSAAYWIASSAREVVATRMAEVGSIGTLMVHQSIARMAQEIGIDFTVFRAGKYKAIGLPVEELTEEDKEHLQADVDKANTFFLEHVSRRRNLMISDKGRWAEGKTFFAGDAQAAGLVDRIASLEDLISAPGASQARRTRMFISDEKRAQIAAGARPEDVLTAEELTQYQAELESLRQEGDEGEGEGTQTGTGDDAGEGEGTQAGTGEGEFDLMADYKQAIRDNGRLEAQVEALKAELDETKAKVATAESRTASLQEVAVVAVHNLQTALGLPKETPGSAEGLVSAFNDMQGKMAARFKPGRQSQGADPGATAEQNLPLSFRIR